MTCGSCIHYPVCSGKASQRGEIFHTDQFDTCKFATTLKDFKHNLEETIAFEPGDVVLDSDVRVIIKGEIFHCEYCEATLFTKLRRNGSIVYRCHGCQQEYEGE